MNRTRPHQTAMRLLLRCALAVGVASCQGLFGLFEVSAQQQAGTESAQPVAKREQTVTVEFDAGPDFAARGANDQSAVSAFQVGFFAGSRLVRAIEIPRDSASVTAGKIRLNVPLAAVTTPKDSSVSIKVRALSSGRLGPWSETAGSVNLPVQDTNKRRARADAQAAAKTPGQTPGDNRQPTDTAKDKRAARRASARQLHVAEIEQNEPLKTLVTQSLDSSITFEQAVGSFAKAHDLAAAALLARKLTLPFAKLCQAVAAAPKRSLAEGLKALQPSINADAEINLVSRDARKLSGRQRPARSQTPPAR